MEQFLEMLSHWSDPEFLARYRNYLVLTVFLYSFLEVIFPPLPGDSLLILSGSISGMSGINPVAIMISALLGTFTSSILLYFLGRKMGKVLLQSSKYSQLLDTKMFHMLEKCFQRYGFWTIFLSRFIPVVRSGIILAAGMVNMGKIKTFLTVGVSIMMSTTIFVMSGRLLGQNWRKLPEFWHDRIRMLFLAILFIIILYLLLSQIWKLLRIQKQKPQEQNE
ncbi:MAG: DedA family protein [Bacteroidota bacterium]